MMWGEVGRGLNVRHLIRRPVGRFNNQYDPWIFLFGPRHIQGLVLDCIKLVRFGDLWVSEYAPNPILQCLLKSKVVLVMIM